jgi:hypothetical protein
MNELELTIGHYNYSKLSHYRPGPKEYTRTQSETRTQPNEYTLPKLSPSADINLITWEQYN